MRIQRTLLKYLLLETGTINVVAVIVWTGYVLCKRSPLEFYDQWPFLFIGLHGIGLAWAIGRVDTSGFAFLYSRGYTRDSLWVYKTITMVHGVLMALSLATVILHSPFRTILFNRPLLYPFEPILPLFERQVLWTWWIGYAIALPLFQYAWIRRGQPSAGCNSGIWLCAALPSASYFTFLYHYSRSFKWIDTAIVGGLLIAGILLFSGWRLHRHLEVSR